MNKKLYIAYGTSLNQRQMKNCCPEAKLFGTGFIPNYQLQFRKTATIVPSPGFSTPAVVWEISRNDERNLDLYEGYPACCMKEKIVVKMNDGIIVNALAYTLNGGYMLHPDAVYFNTILQGYKDFNLNTDYLYRILNTQ